MYKRLRYRWIEHKVVVFRLAARNQQTRKAFIFAHPYSLGEHIIDRDTARGMHQVTHRTIELPRLSSAPSADWPCGSRASSPTGTLCATLPPAGPCSRRSSRCDRRHHRRHTCNMIYKSITKRSLFLRLMVRSNANRWRMIDDVIPLVAPKCHFNSWPVWTRYLIPNHPTNHIPIGRRGRWWLTKLARNFLKKKFGQKSK